MANQIIKFIESAFVQVMLIEKEYELIYLISFQSIINKSQFMDEDRFVVLAFNKVIMNPSECHL